MSIINTSWLDTNTSRNYPFHDSASLISDGATFTIPQNVFVDMAVSVSPEISPDSVYLSLFTISGDFVEAIFSSTDTASEIFKFSFNYLTHTEFRSYPVIPTDTSYPDIYGRVTCGRNLEDLIAEPGAYTFSYAASRITTSCIRPSIEKVTSISVNGVRLSNNLTIAVGAGLAINTDNLTNTISLSVDRASLETEDCGCLDELPCIKTINGVAPDAQGNIELIGEACLDITPLSDVHSVQLVDTCSQPCCDCETLSAISSNVDTLMGNIKEVENFVVDARSKLISAISAINKELGI